MLESGAAGPRSCRALLSTLRLPNLCQKGAFRGSMGTSPLHTLLPCSLGMLSAGWARSGTGDLLQPQLRLACAAPWPQQLVTGPLLDCPLGPVPTALHPNTPRGASGRGLPELCWWEDE